MRLFRFRSWQPCPAYQDGVATSSEPCPGALKQPGKESLWMIHMAHMSEKLLSEGSLGFAWLCPSVL